MKTSIFDFSILKDATFRFGLIILTVSMAVFVFTEEQVIDPFRDDMPFSFFLNYGLFLTYLFMLFVDNRVKHGGIFRFRSLRKNIPLLLLFNVSAYSLNRFIPVFQDSTEWLQGLLISLNLAMVAFCFRPRPLKMDGLNLGILIFLSLGFVLQVYQAFYLIPFYAISGMVFWAFGFSLHSFVAIWFVITLFKMIRQYVRVADFYRWIALGAMATPLVMFVAFGLKWNEINQVIEQNYYAKHAVRAKQILPDWVKVSQQLDNNWITKRALKSELVYTVLEREWGGEMFFPRNSFGNNMNERLQHDPFVALTPLVFGKINLDAQEKFKLYQATFNARHQTEERLWSGDHLVTSDIVTTVQLFPEHRIAYTESIFTIKNNYLETNSWRNRNNQEAIYSFYLPDGAVVTSASLWVEGEERKSFLTTRSKADSAYKAIVGVERRDPLLLHWQEGNRISVRIFPCTPTEDRMFKIGITTPLHFENKKLTYTNIDFEGPNWAKAKESIHVISEGEINHFKSSLGLKSSDVGWTYFGKYHSKWDITIDAPPLAYSTFSFNGRSFRVQDYLPLTEKFLPENIYLDINSSWSKRQCNQIWKAAKDKKVFVFDGKIKEVTAENHKKLFGKLRQKRFSLFPFYEIKNVEQSLVVTQGGQFTPALSDIKKSLFAKNTSIFLTENKTPIRVYNLGEDLTIYLKTLRELKVFNFQKGNVKELLQQWSDKRFPKYPTNPNLVSIPYSNIQIETVGGEQKLNNAPDHLLRLFAYNDMMKKIGRSYFNQEYITEQLIGQAKEAYVVTPISSMIVLETQKDYDRFGIEEAKNSLKNASIGESGSVPEPHEWLLIILCMVTMLFLRFRRV